MSTPTTPFDAVLHAARDVAKVDSALDAEMLGAALLGSVYAIAETERVAAVRDFVGGFLRHTARRRGAAAQAIRRVFATLVPDADGADRISRGQAPPWSAQLGRVRLRSSHAYGDVYGDQTSYLAVFGYDDAETGGPEHAVVALVDHNIGIVKDVFVGHPAQRVVAEVRKAADTDELVWLEEVDPAVLRADVSRYLAITDGLSQLPDDGSLATDRALVGARLAALPQADPAQPPAAVGPPTRAASAPADRDPAALVPAFLESPYAAGLDRSTEEAQASLYYAVRLILDFASDAPDTDPLRWSPAVVGLFLLDWVHRRAVLDDQDVAVLPVVLRAWVAWAAERRALPRSAALGTDAAIDTMQPEFVRLHGTGERRGPAAEAMALMLAQGVDPGDPAALQAWLAANLPAGNPANGESPERSPEP